MTSSLKVMLAAAGIAALVTPVMAKNPTQEGRHEHLVPGETHPFVQDCVRVAFPQCSGWSRAKHHHYHHHHPDIRVRQDA